MPEVLTSEGPMAADEPDLSIFENKSGLAEDLKFLASMPELCDVTFLVGETREPVCAVKVGWNSTSSKFIIPLLHKVLHCMNPRRFKSGLYVEYTVLHRIFAMDQSGILDGKLWFS